MDEFQVKELCCNNFKLMKHLSIFEEGLRKLEI